MYSDHLAAGRKRSIQERLYGDLDPRRPSSSADTSGKRQRNTEEKWRFGAFQDDKVLPHSKNQVDARGVRLNNLATGLRQIHQNQNKKKSGDLREKLSGSLPTQPTSIDLAKTKPVPVKAGLVQKKEPSEKPAVLDTQKVTTSKLPQQKSESSVDGLLQSLGLEKYSITFKKEEVDMTVLLHMTDTDLKALGIPMGPRKKIMWALSSRKQKQ